jgi:EAL domain-containing protein (putative c-di-GMP-specific phosphodiesterase class I)
VVKNRSQQAPLISALVVGAAGAAAVALLPRQALAVAPVLLALAAVPMLAVRRAAAHRSGPWGPFAVTTAVLSVHAAVSAIWPHDHLDDEDHIHVLMACCGFLTALIAGSASIVGMVRTARPLLSHPAGRSPIRVAATALIAGAAVFAVLDVLVRLGSPDGAVHAVAAVLALCAGVSAAAVAVAWRRLTPTGRGADLLILVGGSLVLALMAAWAVNPSERWYLVACLAGVTMLVAAAAHPGGVHVGRPVSPLPVVTVVPQRPAVVAAVAVGVACTALLVRAPLALTAALAVPAAIAVAHAALALGGGAHAPAGFTRRERLARHLPGALVRGQLSLHYQPLRHLASGKTSAFEATVVWAHRELGHVSLAEMRSTATSLGIGPAVDLHVVARCAPHLPTVLSCTELDEPWLSVPLQAASLDQPGFAEEVLRTLADCDASADGITFTLDGLPSSAMGFHNLATLRQALIAVSLPASVATSDAAGERLAEPEFVTVPYDLWDLGRFSYTVQRVQRSGAFVVATGVHDPSDVRRVGRLGADFACGDAIGPPVSLAVLAGARR